MPDLLFVGTGDAFGSGGRRNSGILLRGREQTLLLDCGPTTLVGLKELGRDPREIDAVAGGGGDVVREGRLVALDGSAVIGKPMRNADAAGVVQSVAAD